MGEFARILRISRTPRVAFQLLQTMSIMIQNIKSENSICECNPFVFSEKSLIWYSTRSWLPQIAIIYIL